MKIKSYTQEEVDKLMKTVVEEMSVWAKTIIEDISTHNKTAPETEKKLNEIYDILKGLGCAKHNERVHRLENVIYGDDMDKSDIGMKRKLDEMHQFFVGSKGSAKLVVWVFGMMGTIAVGWLAFKNFMKSF